jgi:DNA primase
LVKQAEPIMEFYFERALSLGNKNDLEGKKIIASYFLPQIKKLKNALDRAYWIEKTAQVLEISPQVLKDELNKISSEVKKEIIDENESLSSSFSLIEPSTRKTIIAERLLSFLVKYPQLKELYLPFFDYFPKQYKEIIDILKDFKGEELKLEEGEFKEETLELFKVLSLRADYEEDLLNQYNVLKEVEIEKGLKELKKEVIKEKLAQLEKEIQETEKTNNKKELENLIKQFKKFSEELIN